MHRFTPRTRGSIWSAVNLARIHELMALGGPVAAAGREAFERRDHEAEPGVLVREQEQAAVAAARAEVRAPDDAGVERTSSAQPPGYQKLCTFFVMSAKKDETRAATARRADRDLIARRKRFDMM